MGRVRRAIEVDGQRLWTLFDTGSRRTYIAAEAARDLPTQVLRAPRKAALGGRTHTVDRVCLLQATVEGKPVEGKPVEGEAAIVDAIGRDEEGATIDLLFGALLMQQWSIRVCPDTESLDLTHYPDEFVEF